MKRWQQLLSFYLALCVALAGAVGLSPVLHVMVEHGGQGRAHSHAGFQTDQVGTEHARLHSHPHESVPARTDDALERRLAEKYPQPKLFGLEPQDIYRAIDGWLTRAFQHLPAPGNEGEGHTHHSLSQMLLNGAVEAGLDVSPLVCAPGTFTFPIELSSAPFVVVDFDPQTASRAPPARV